MIRQILLAFDGSEHSWSAWHYARDLALAYRCPIKAVSVIDSRVASYSRNADAVTSSPLGPVHDSAEPERFTFEAQHHTLLDELRQQAVAFQVHLEAEVAHGIPAQVICLEETHVDLIAMGHRGETPVWQRVMLGSNAEAVIRQCSRPLLLSPERYRPMERVLACYDGSENATRALYAAARIAEQMRLPMMVLSVNRDANRARQIVDEVDLRLKAASLAMEKRTDTGMPADCILNAAATCGCGLVVMGVHGHAMVRESLIGRTTEEVMRRASMAILLVK